VEGTDGPQRVAELVSDTLPQRFGYDPRFDIQVLTPMNQGPLGTIALNQALQERLNPAVPGRATLEFRERVFRVRDKVMQLRNNYDKNVYNGDVGYVSAVSKSEKTVTVDFDGQPIAYQGEEVGELALAYAVTVHKSQGSEFRAVVMLASRAHWIMLQRNLLYTGITRARERLVLADQGRMDLADAALGQHRVPSLHADGMEDEAVPLLPGDGFRMSQ
jgi:exodeoxyribonuclease V alpha subunit